MHSAKVDPPARRASEVQSAGLLVSVRSAVEAEAALAGGADLIDVKEPSRGALGRADDETIAAVVRTVAGRRPVSAALGELASRHAPIPPGLAYVKWGLAGQRSNPEWWSPCAEPTQQEWRTVLVAYADWQRADAPTPGDVCACARSSGATGFLLDTFRKDGSTLIDWLTHTEIEALVRCCRTAGLEVALAGSLGPEQIAHLAPLRPDWFGVRGAACRQGERAAAIDPDRVRELAALVHQGKTSDSLEAVPRQPPHGLLHLQRQKCGGNLGHR